MKRVGPDDSIHSLLFMDSSTWKCGAGHILLIRYRNFPKLPATYQSIPINLTSLESINHEKLIHCASHTTLRLLCNSNRSWSNHIFSAQVYDSTGQPSVTQLAERSIKEITEKPDNLGTALQRGKCALFRSKSD